MKLSDQDDLAKLAFGLTRGLPTADAKEILAGMFSTQHDITPDFAWALFVRGKHLAEVAGEKVA